MKNHPTKNFPDFAGMWSSDPADRIPPENASVLRNAYVDKKGVVRKAYGASTVALASSFGLTTASGRTRVHSQHVYEGKRGEFPDARMLVLSGSSLLRSRASDLYNTWDTILFPVTAETPALARPASGLFRGDDFYHQNGFDVPFRVECETDSAASPSITAEVLGLMPPPYAFNDIKANGVGTRFPLGKPVSYAVTYVYGNRGESGPSPVQHVIYSVTGAAEFVLNHIPTGPAGVTARRIYRTKIGQGHVTTASGSTLADSAEWEKTPQIEMFLLTELHDNATSQFTDDKDDNAMDFGTRCPNLVVFPPRAKYQALHLDRIFSANLFEHPWVMQVAAQVEHLNALLVSATITIDNTAGGTITLTANDGFARTLTINNYKSKSLATIRDEIASGIVGSSAGYMVYDGSVGLQPTVTWWVPRRAPGVDDTRSYTFKEVAAQSILGSSAAFWFCAIVDANNQGCQWFPNRVQYSDVLYPERVLGTQSFDIANQGGSKKINALTVYQGSLAISTEDDWYIVSGDFVPDREPPFLPNVQIDRSQSGHGSICTRPDCTSTNEQGIFFVSTDGLRLFRGLTSVPVGRPVDDWFLRVKREPVARDFLSMIQYEGQLLISLPAYERAA